MAKWRVVTLTVVALAAFASNSLLCRAALAHTRIDPASFTSIRLLSGAIVLSAILWARRGSPAGQGNWWSALALFVYGAAFSFSYVSLTAATGALILFGAVQITMIGHGLWSGESLRATQIVGIVLACGGLVGLLLPGLSAPPLSGALFMLAAGIAWGVYSIRGKGAADPLAVTSGNFALALTMAVLLSVVMLPASSFDVKGAWYAFMSGALASGVGYAIWYAVLPHLKSTVAATVQLAVPVIAALLGALLLGEALTTRLLFAAAGVIGGIALVVAKAGPIKPPLRGSSHRQ